MLRLILCDFAGIQSRQAQIAGDIWQEMTIGPQATSLHARLESPAEHFNNLALQPGIFFTNHPKSGRKATTSSSVFHFFFSTRLTLIMTP